MIDTGESKETLDIIKEFISVDSWRWMLGAETIPAIIYNLMCFTLPESPRWLITNGKREEGKKVLAQINTEFSSEELETLVTKIESADQNDAKAQSGRLNWGKLRIPIAVSAFFAFMMCLHLLWVHFLVPETKGVRLEDMERKLNDH